MQSPIQFLLTTIFDIYTYVILLRFMLQLFRADFYNPLSQFVVKVTNPILVPMRKVIPGIGGLDVASLVFAYLVIMVRLFLDAALVGKFYSIGLLMFDGVTSFIYLTVMLIFWLVLIRAVMSWISPGINNPFMMVIYQVSEPIMAPLRRIIPPMGGLDLSPIVLILGLQFLLKALNAWVFSPLRHMLFW